MGLLRTIVETDTLTISRSDGGTDRAVVAFTGIGLAFGGLQIHEFQHSLAAGSVTNTVYHVVDKQRSWYELTFDAIKEHLTPELSAFGEVVTLGNSMGGFGAILFAGVLPRCRRALAFVPQFSVAANVAGRNETRWREYTSRITNWKLSHALMHFLPSIRYYLFFGDNTDIWHVGKFQKWGQENIGVNVVKGFGHDVAGHLKERNLLVAVVDDIVNRAATFEDITKLLQSHGIRCDLNTAAGSFAGEIL